MSLNKTIAGWVLIFVLIGGLCVFGLTMKHMPDGTADWNDPRSILAAVSGLGSLITAVIMLVDENRPMDRTEPQEPQNETTGSVGNNEPYPARQELSQPQKPKHDEEVDGRPRYERMEQT